MSFEWTDKKDGDIILANDPNTLAEGIKEVLASIPTKTSQLENDSNYVNKTYVDNKTIYDITDGKISTQRGYLTLGDGTEFSKITIQGGRVEAGNGVQINNLQSPILDNDAANKKYVDDKYTVLSQSEYNAITEKDPDKIYFVYEDET